MTRTRRPNLFISRRIGLDKVAGRYEIDAKTGCWLWQHYRDQYGYGIFVDYDRNSRRRVNMRAHRFTYATVYGSIPVGLCVLHKCDTPNCINPDHLFVGSQADNNADMCKKGRNRNRRGSDVPNSKLDARKVKAIRHMLAVGTYARIIAGRFGVSNSLIYAIKSEKAWKHV